MSFDRYTEKAHLKNFDPILLEEMKGVELMNRIDTKFVIKRDVFNQILPFLAENYRALEVEGTMMSAYKTQYFDTQKYNFFLDHHNGSGLRFKVRIRQYVESDLFFLEVKKKFKGRTDKKRITVEDFEPQLSQHSAEYVQKVLNEGLDLEMKLYNTFDRITLVNKFSKERLTIDMNLAYENASGSKSLDHLVIAELKQERFDTLSPFYLEMKKHIIRPSGFSKYCIGAISLNERLKYNNFKTKLMLIEKYKN